MRRSLLALLACLAAVGGSAQSTDRAPFTVEVQSPDGEPLPGASVMLGDRGGAADADGRVTFENVRPGRYPLRVSFIGRPTRELAAVLNAPGPWGLIVEMVDTTTLLYDVVVEGRDLSRSRLVADGFFERQALGGGTILDAEDIAYRSPLHLADLLRGGVLGVRVRDGRFGPVATSWRTGCTMDVYLDGVYSSILTESLDAFPAQGLVAVEVYRGATQIPLRYRRLAGTPGGGRRSGCGVVLAWTELSIAPDSDT
ncbi:carboxypeptidase regulatory-like domain-containing protein [Rubrivirga marina]|uniref:TonB-dependent receptor plug domain-containing protein n=1 Tax=Rubrivirga marina TaxID=1196024 RepID=A0A271J5G0_9BACT|nr:carboxypeptidase regulatory-like domain-containing protein [Rubrivirga marina]PAP78304.1 hypothetical protein BSZ37_18670 [Rubrivirga marina]